MIKSRIFRKYLSTNRSKPFFITTPIFYVNAAPHIGHLYSAVIADAICRFEKLISNELQSIIFTTGTDEHGSKIQEAATKFKLPISDYCKNISKEYKTLFSHTHINYTDYIRTTEERHKKAVHSFWNRLNDKGHITLSQYSGWYCVSDETFLTENQIKLSDSGKKVSIDSGHVVEWTSEENYIFKLANFQNDIINWIKDGDRIKPKHFEKILLDNLCDKTLPDVSISRPKSRVHWGIAVPNDENQTIYVWLDALINYLTCSNYPDGNYQENWPPNVQVIGKDIMKFHGIYWPAFLIAAGLEPPRSLMVHSHWTVDDQKMSKSKNNVVNPNDLANIYTYEGVRYFLLREGVAHSDGNYSNSKIFHILNSELADTLGNLISRCCAKSLNPLNKFPNVNDIEFKNLLEHDFTRKLIDLLTELPAKTFHHYKLYNFYLVVDQIIEVLHACNNFVEKTKPWELRKMNNFAKLDTVLSISFETLRICGIILQPIIPAISTKLLDKLNVDKGCRNWKNVENFIWTNNTGNKYDDTPLGTSDAILYKRIRLEDTKSLTKR